jgi:hypothetical protein
MVRLRDDWLRAESRRPEGGGGLRAKPERADKRPTGRVL